MSAHAGTIGTKTATAPARLVRQPELARAARTTSGRQSGGSLITIRPPATHQPRRHVEASAPADRSHAPSRRRTGSPAAITARRVDNTAPCTRSRRSRARRPLARGSRCTSGADRRASTARSGRSLGHHQAREAATAADVETVDVRVETGASIGRACTERAIARTNARACSTTSSTGRAPSRPRRCARPQHLEQSPIEPAASVAVQDSVTTTRRVGSSPSEWLPTPSMRGHHVVDDLAIGRRHRLERQRVARLAHLARRRCARTARAPPAGARGSRRRRSRRRVSWSPSRRWAATRARSWTAASVRPPGPISSPRSSPSTDDLELAVDRRAARSCRQGRRRRPGPRRTRLRPHRRRPDRRAGPGLAPSASIGRSLSSLPQGASAIRSAARSIALRGRRRPTSGRAGELAARRSTSCWRRRHRWSRRRLPCSVVAVGRVTDRRAPALGAPASGAPRSVGSGPAPAPRRGSRPNRPLRGSSRISNSASSSADPEPVEGRLLAPRRPSCPSSPPIPCLLRSC